MEEKREQPIIMPATTLNLVDENSAMSEIGSLHDLGKFKTVQALKDAYDSLEVEFTKKCQKLSQLQKDKTENLSKKEENNEVEKEVSAKEVDEQKLTEKIDNFVKIDKIFHKNDEKTHEDAEIISNNDENASERENDLQEENNENDAKDEQIALSKTGENSFDDEEMKKFLECNFDASCYADEIKERFKSVDIKNSDPFEVAWAQVLLSHIKEGDKASDPLINQYVLSDKNVRKKVIEDYLDGLRNSKPPLVISSQSGERVSGVMPDSPKTLADAKRLVDKMFS